MREKLIELLRSVQYQGNAVHGYHDKYIQNSELADHLIANGVTIATDNNVGDKVSPTGWIPVSERLPQTMGKYLCRYVFGEEEGYPFEQVLWYYPQLEKPHFQHEGSMGLRVTHWMSLPQPPKEGER